MIKTGEGILENQNGLKSSANKVILEGDDVTKKFATKTEKLYKHKKGR